MSNNNKLQDIYNYFFLGTGGTQAAIVFWSDVDLIAGLVLKLTSLVSFAVFLLINQDNIESNLKKFIQRFKKKK